MNYACNRNDGNTRLERHESYDPPSPVSGLVRRPHVFETPKKILGVTGSQGGVVSLGIVNLVQGMHELDEGLLLD